MNNGTTRANTARTSAASSRKRLSTIVGTAVASGATTLIVALTMGWLTVGRSAVGRDEVVEMIASGAPYVAERQALHNSVDLNTGRIDELTRQLREIERQGHRVEAKLDLLLSRAVKSAPHPNNDMTR